MGLRWWWWVMWLLGTMAGCAPSADPVDAPVEENAIGDGADPMCCPVGSLGYCGCTPRGGWRGHGCFDICDLGADRIAVDDHGCPYLTSSGDCRCLCVDAGLDARPEWSEDGGEEDGGDASETSDAPDGAIDL